MILKRLPEPYTYNTFVTAFRCKITGALTRRIITISTGKLKKKKDYLRTVPIFVTARTFCVSRDTRVSYGWCLLIQGYFCAV